MQYLLIICLLLFPITASGFNWSDTPKEKKLLYVNAAGLAVITGWGIVNWDYFSTAPSAKNEGWFAGHTKEGGADKLGHFYASYALSHFLGHTFETWGYSQKQGLKLDGFDQVTHPLLKYLELHLGYYARGFSSKGTPKRTLYAGIGINLSRILNKFSLNRLSTLAEFVQVPYTYKAFETDR
ncbi:MAG: DUF2279 domain-containing protein [Thermodesulfobacteriota bacterium]